jgi:hypothetical protein
MSHFASSMLLLQPTPICLTQAPPVNHVKSVYELEMLVVIVAKEKRLILSFGEASGWGLLAILIDNKWNLSKLVE